MNTKKETEQYTPEKKLKRYGCVESHLKPEQLEQLGETKFHLDYKDFDCTGKYRVNK